MTSKNIQLGCTVAFALTGLIAASSGDAKWHPKPKHKAATSRAAVMTHTSTFGGNTTVQPSTEVSISVGRGQLINLGQPISDVFTSNGEKVDVNVRSTTQIYLFGKTEGTASIYATNKAGQIVYSANVFVEQNINSLDQMLRTAMPDAQISTTKINGMIILNGVVLNPEDAAQAEVFVNSYVGNDPTGKKKIQVLNRIKTATPQQVNLQVRIAEVSHTVAKNIGSNLVNRDQSGSMVFGVASGRGGAATIGTQSLAGYPTRDFSTQFGYPAGTLGALPYNPANPGVPINPVNPGVSYVFNQLANATTLGLGGRLFGMDIGAALDLAETKGEVTTLAQPNLTALSGETASFLAGGEIPIPIATQNGTGTSVSVEYKSYGVSLSFTPIVLADGRISMRVRPEVSQLTNDGAVSIAGLTIPALSVRRSETTVELGSGQSMVIGGLMSNQYQSTTSSAPGLGDVPVLGAMFRSNAYKRGETELMIVVTPYLVKPVNANQIVLPTDGKKAPTDLQRVLLGKDSGESKPADRPKPSMAPPATKVAPALGALDPLPVTPAKPQPAAPEKVGQAVPVTAPQPTSQPRKTKTSNADDAAPGFGS